MSSLSSSLAIASQSLQAQELEIQVTNNNIANVDTAGYTRETVNLSEADPTQYGSVSIGNGVDIQGVTSVRDDLLSLRIQQQTSQQSSAQAQVNALTQIESLFPTSGSSLSTSLSSFFTSLSSLSTNPTSTADRQTVLQNAQTLVGQFNSISAGLSGPSSGLDTNVDTDVNQINQLSTQAASLNVELVQQQAAGQSTGTISDQLNEVETQLANLTNISVTHTSQGDSIVTGSGTPLVLGSQSFALQTAAGSDGHQQILDSNGTDITSSISSGDLGGTLQVRDTQIPALQNSLDTLANQFATAFNAAQTQGYDQNGNTGAALFTIPTTVSGSAAAIKLATTDPTAIAAQFGWHIRKQWQRCESDSIAEFGAGIRAERHLAVCKPRLPDRQSDRKCDRAIDCYHAEPDSAEQSAGVNLRRIYRSGVSKPDPVSAGVCRCGQDCHYHSESVRYHN